MNIMFEYEFFRLEKIKDGGWYVGIIFCFIIDKVFGNLVVDYLIFKVV